MRKPPKLLALAALAVAALVLASGDAITAPIIQYASVIIKPGNPTTTPFQAQIGSVYVDKSGGPQPYVKYGAAANQWSPFVMSGGAGTYTLNDLTVENLTANNSLTCGSVSCDGSQFTGTTPFASISATGTIGTAALTYTSVNGWTLLTQAANQDITNSTTLTDSNTFSFSVPNTGPTIVHGELYLSNDNAANDCQFRFTVVAGTQIARGQSYTLGTADAIQTTAIITAAVQNSATITVGTSTSIFTPQTVVFDYAVVPSNNTTFRVQFSEAVAAPATSCRMYKGSYVTYKAL